MTTSGPATSREDRIARLRQVRRADSDDRRRRAQDALRQLQRQGSLINRSSVARKAGLHRNFFLRHPDLGALVDEAGRQSATSARPSAADRVTETSLRVELVRARRINEDLNQRLRALEARLSHLAGENVEALLEGHPEMLRLKRELERLEFECVEARRLLAERDVEIEALRLANRDLALQIMRATPQRAAPRS